MPSDLGLDSVDFYGCMLGLVGHNGGPIKKAWTICTDCAELRAMFSGLTCPGKAHHPTHEPCAGVNTKMIELYTWMFTKKVHAAYKKYLAACPATAETCPSVVGNSQSHPSGGADGVRGEWTCLRALMASEPQSQYGRCFMDIAEEYGEKNSDDEMVICVSLDKLAEFRAKRKAKRQSLHDKVAEKVDERSNGSDPAHRAAPAKEHPNADIRMWLVDTGCGYDLVSKAEVAKVKELVRKAAKAIVLHTANAKVDARDAIDLFVQELNERIREHPSCVVSRVSTLISC